MYVYKLTHFWLVQKRWIRKVQDVLIFTPYGVSVDKMDQGYPKDWVIINIIEMYIENVFFQTKPK